jgi:hypothetical protein
MRFIEASNVAYIVRYWLLKFSIGLKKQLPPPFFLKGQGEFFKDYFEKFF